MENSKNRPQKERLQLREDEKKVINEYALALQLGVSDKYVQLKIKENGIP